MAKNKGTRIVITLECTECRTNENQRTNGVSRYTTKKNRKKLLSLAYLLEKLLIKYQLQS